jgi:hypothetical protein
MTATMNTPCDSLNLTHEESWATHAATERWLRNAVEQNPSDCPIEQAGRILERIETADELSHADLMLLRDIASDAAPDTETPDRDRQPLRSVADTIQTQLRTCFP